MEREITEVYCGNGKGKTTLAVGRGLRFATQGKSVIIIQFLKGRERRELDFLEELDNFDFKIFRFEKCNYSIFHRSGNVERTAFRNFGSVSASHGTFLLRMHRTKEHQKGFGRKCALLLPFYQTNSAPQTHARPAPTDCPG